MGTGAEGSSAMVVCAKQGIARVHVQRSGRSFTAAVPRLNELRVSGLEGGQLKSGWLKGGLTELWLRRDLDPIRDVHPMKVVLLSPQSTYCREAEYTSRIWRVVHLHFEWPIELRWNSPECVV